MLDFMKARQNPFIIVSSLVTLHNIDTNVAVVNTIKTRFLKTLENGVKTYQAYRNERFVDKSAKLAATIHRVNLPHFDSQSSSSIDAALTTGKISIISAKKVAAAQREIEIVKERLKTMVFILNHDLLDNSPLFEDGTVPQCTEPDKSHQLAKELEKHIATNKYDFQPDSSSETDVILHFL